MPLSYTTGVSPTTKSISAGGNHTCALASNGTVYCWGDDHYDQVGAISSGTSTCGSLPCVMSPTSVQGNFPAAVQAVAAGGQPYTMDGPEHTCVLLSGGTVACWGGDVYGQLGAPVPSVSLYPCNVSGVACTGTAVAVAGVTGATALSAGGQHTCALLSGGSVSCWGLNASGQLGSGMTNSYPDAGVQMAAAVSGLTGATSISAGGQHTCAVVSGGTVQCWGDNFYGQLGTGSAASTAPYGVPTPMPVSL